jgi:hypothetical protein
MIRARAPDRWHQAGTGTFSSVREWQSAIRDYLITTEPPNPSPDCKRQLYLKKIARFCLQASDSEILARRQVLRLSVLCKPYRRLLVRCDLTAQDGQR